ncbi:hypothetical protein [Actinoplanes palleronii]|uniref:Uncharacterized protein n=1 Tax=Actinoplanes palleronii TaxID=113570 RepID=A0ABQ4BC86_9ACTN|nr:hypothetical protein [Actinoplanes palleronii]GIE68267.1 hypothetical protein Apa02nite_043750 [Actinoplanes palleronii]
MTSVDDVYERAVDFGADGEVPAGTPIGTAHLSHVMRVYNSILGGGLGSAVAVVEPDEFERAVAGFRYLGLREIADLLARLVESYGRPEHDFREQRGLEELLSSGDPVSDAFATKAAEIPSDFGLTSS